jgi:hypothetical protein
VNRRDALKALAAVVAATGLTVTPITAEDVRGVELILLKVRGRLSQDSMANIRAVWRDGVRGTALEYTMTIVLASDVDVEFVRSK